MTTETIYKYELLINDRQPVQMPEGAEILTIQTQDNEPVLWAKVNPKNMVEFREIEMFGTGNPIPTHDDTSRVYINTIQMGVLVWHFFERIR